MTDKELAAFMDCMEANAWYNTQTLSPIGSLLAEVYLMRTETITKGE